MSRQNTTSSIKQNFPVQTELDDDRRYLFLTKKPKDHVLEFSLPEKSNQKRLIQKNLVLNITIFTAKKIIKTILTFLKLKERTRRKTDLRFCNNLVTFLSLLNPATTKKKTIMNKEFNINYKMIAVAGTITTTDNLTLRFAFNSPERKFWLTSIEE